MRRSIILLIGYLFTTIGITNAQVGIGTTNPVPSSMLDVSSTNKGVIFPRVALNSNTDKATIESPEKGILVYNTGASGLKVEGYMFWDGSEWKRFNAGTTTNPSITALQCNNATISPTIFKANQPYEGIMIVPYTGGNGGSYPAGDPISSSGNTGLTATLQSGELSYGNGELVYTLSGTPDYSSPEPAVFNIDVFGHQCEVSVSGNVLAIGEYLTFIGTMPATGVTDGTLLSSSYPDQLPVIDGLRMDVAYNTQTYYRPRIYNISSNSQVVSFQTFATVVNENKTTLNLTLASNNYLSADNNDVVYWTTGAAEVLTTNLQVQVSPGIWRWYEFTWWAMEIESKKTVFMSVVRKA